MAVASDSRSAPSARPFAATLMKMRRRALEDWIENAIALLDTLDPDPEMEEDDPGGCEHDGREDDR